MFFYNKVVRKAGCEVPEYMLRLNTKRLKNLVKSRREKQMKMKKIGLHEDHPLRDEEQTQKRKLKTAKNPLKSEGPREKRVKNVHTESNEVKSSSKPSLKRLKSKSGGTKSGGSMKKKMEIES